MAGLAVADVPSDRHRREDLCLCSWCVSGLISRIMLIYRLIQLPEREESGARDRPRRKTDHLKLARDQFRYCQYLFLRYCLVGRAET